MVKASLIAAALLITSSAAAQTADWCGRAVTIIGTVEIERSGVKSPLVTGGTLHEGDVVHTGAASTARLLMRDKGVLDIGPSSRLKFNTYKVDPVSRTRKASVRMFLGKLWARVSKATGSDQNFEVSTTNAVAGVRGTSFGVGVGANGETTVTVGEGMVNVENSAGESTNVGALQKATVSGSGGSASGTGNSGGNSGGANSGGQSGSGDNNAGGDQNGGDGNQGGDNNPGGGIEVEEITADQLNEAMNDVTPEATLDESTTSVGTDTTGGGGDAGAGGGGTGAGESGEGGTNEQAPEEAEASQEAPEAPQVELDPGSGNTHVRGRAEVKN